MNTVGRPRKYKTVEERKEAYAKKAREAYKQKKAGEVRSYRREGVVEEHRGCPWYRMYHGAKTRAKNNNIEFSLDIEFLADIWQEAEVCPVFGKEFVTEGRHSFNKSLDRIDSSKGYTKDNVWIISQRANTIKNNATLEELVVLVEALKQKNKLNFP